VATTDGLDEIIVALRDGDTLGSVLLANGAREGSVAPVEAAFETFLNTTACARATACASPWRPPVKAARASIRSASASMISARISSPSR
jgi:hypothetical protein